VDGTPFLSGLVDVEQLRAGGSDVATADGGATADTSTAAKYDGQWSGQNEGWSGVGRPAVGGQSAGSRGGSDVENASSAEEMRAAPAVSMRNARLGLVAEAASYAGEDVQVAAVAIGA
jgi:hypothetical protein